MNEWVDVGEERGRREKGKVGEKSMREQASVNSFSLSLSLCVALFTINAGCQPTQLCVTKANTMEVWCPAAIYFDFFCDKKRFVAQSNQTTASQTHNETGHTRTHTTPNETL